MTAEGDVVMAQDGTEYRGHWRLEDGVVSLYVGDHGPFATQAGGLGAEGTARLLMREFLDGRKAQEGKLK